MMKAYVARFTVLAALLGAVLVPAGAATAEDLSFDQAYDAISAAIQKAEEMDVKMNIALVDAGANLKMFARMDGAWLGSIDISIKKAKTARFFDMPTGEVGKLSQPGGALYNIEHSNDGLITFPGGLPITNADGVIIGAIGVSGSTVENDHAVAEAGVAAVGGATAETAASPEEAVKNSVTKVKTALETLDIDLLMDQFSNDFEHPEAGDKETAKQMLQMGMEMGYADDGEVSLDDMEIEVDGDTATVYPVDLSSPAGSVAVELQYQKEPGGWKIIGLDVEGI
jgi:uncharacterized protein GlcG (DUF336 family)